MGSDLASTPKKTVCSTCGQSVVGYRDKRQHIVRDMGACTSRIYLEFEYRRVDCPKCQAVRQETLAWLASSHRFTKRFEERIGKECRDMPLSRVAENNGLSWDQVRRIEMAYMQDLINRHPPPADLRAIGMDEVSISKGHRYATVVADLVVKRPIWLGGEGRKEEDLQGFYDEMGAERCATIKLAVMDMWKPFRNVTQRNAPQARIVYDKFHILGHLADAMDAVRRIEYKRVNDKERTYIKGQRYTLLSNRANLDLDGRRALRLLLKANKRLNKAYLLKESFGQMWDYNSPVWCRKFFDNWQAQLRWSRLEPFKKFAAMVERHWDGIVSYCHPDNKVSLGFMEGLNNLYSSS